MSCRTNITVQDNVFILEAKITKKKVKPQTRKMNEQNNVIGN